LHGFEVCETLACIKLGLWSGFLARFISSDHVVFDIRLGAFDCYCEILILTWGEVRGTLYTDGSAGSALCLGFFHDAIIV
jgi:hypothetical protein